MYLDHTRYDVDPPHMLYKPIEWCVKTAEPMLYLSNDRHGVQKWQNRSRCSCDVIPYTIDSPTIADTAHNHMLLGRLHAQNGGTDDRPIEESDSEYDNDCQDQVANGTMVDYVMDELFTLYTVSIKRQQCIQYS